MPQLQFKGKQFVENYHFTVPYRVLKPVPSKSFPKGRASLDDNLIIHGDNLAALKALLPKYAGQIKCIYIDPPYNTGNEHWIYSDNVNSPMMKEWLGKEVGRDDLTRHDKWLCMMMPRLKLLRELLRDDGVIFVSIDDENEPHRLRMLMDEIFDEDNFICTFIWKKKGGASNTESYVGVITEYILCYAKTKNKFIPNRRFINKEYKFFDEKKGAYYALENLVKTDKGIYKRDTMKFAVINPNTGEEIYPPEGKRWTAGKKTIEELINQDLIHFGKDKFGNNTIYLKKYSTEIGAYGVFLNLLLEKGSLESAKNELASLGFDREIFDTPKPSILIKHLLSIVVDKNSIILDSFAGTGTTGHAVLALNKEDGGNRKFILVEMEDYADKITAERMRRVIKGIPTAKDENLRNGLGGSFTFVELGEAIDNEGILSGKRLPSFIDMARYVFYTATGKNINEKKIKESTGFIGETEEYQVYLLYKPDLEWLKTTALDLEKAKKIAGKKQGNKKLVFAPAKYLDEESLKELNIEFAQLPFGIYRR